MLCDICKAKKATIHIQEIIGSEKTMMHLCQSCAEKKAHTEAIMNMDGLNLADLLLQFSEHCKQSINDNPELAEQTDKSSLTCPACGWDSANFQKTGSLGCPDCYETFHDVLDHTVDAMHRGTSHAGKQPVSLDGPDVKRPKPSVSLIHMNIKHLQMDLETAVSAENYEEAAKIRDKIAELNKNLEALQNE